MRVSHVYGGTFVADINDADALTRHMVPDRLDVSTLQAEHAVDATGPQEPCDPGGAGLRIGIQVLRHCSWFVHRCPRYCRDAVNCGGSLAAIVIVGAGFFRLPCAAYRR